MFFEGAKYFPGKALLAAGLEFIASFLCPPRVGVTRSTVPCADVSRRVQRGTLFPGALGPHK